MRIFKNCEEAINEIERDLFEIGVRVKVPTVQDKDVRGLDEYETKEMEGYSFMILDQSDKDEMVSNQKEDLLRWNRVEHLERISISHINPGEAYKLRSDVWNEFLHDGKFAYTYNERIRGQLNPIIAELKKNLNTRQALIEIHNNQIDLENVGGKSRICCSCFYQFLYREGKLDVIYTMRSSDFYTHFRNDIWQAIELRNHVAKELGQKEGKFIMFVSSLHAFKKDFPKGIF